MDDRQSPDRCGRTGIRTLERVAPLTVFKTVAFVRSAILPGVSLPGDPGAHEAGHQVEGMRLEDLRDASDQNPAIWEVLPSSTGIVAELPGKSNLRRRRSMSKPPSGGGARVGKVCAIRTGADGTAKMLAELGMVLTDPGYRVADRAGHSDSSTLGRGCG